MNDLIQHLRKREEGAAFSVTRHGGLARVEALRGDADAGLHAYASEEASWDDGALVLEQRYVPEFVDRAIDAGYTFLRP